MQSQDEGADQALWYRAARFLYRRTLCPILRVLGSAARVVRNLLMSAVGSPDYQRWTSPEGLEAWWSERTQQMATLVTPMSRVIEFGAGRRDLERYLPDGCAYIPSDLVDRGAGTVVLDLNRRPLPNLSHLAPDVAVFGGVLEYMYDLSSLLRWLYGTGVTTCVASYDPVPQHMGPLARIREWQRRSSNGYMTHLTEDQLLQRFSAAGFFCDQRQTWRNQVILKLSTRR